MGKNEELAANEDVIYEPFFTRRYIFFKTIGDGFTSKSVSGKLFLKRSGKNRGTLP